MKKILLSLCAIAAICVTACANGNSKTKDSNSDMKTDNKVLVAYFSATGTTAGVAEKIADIAGAETIEIQPVEPYTDADLDWNDKNSRSSVEMNNPSSRPAVKPSPVDIAKKYDVIFIGYPIWWDLAPTAVNTFIEQNNLNGKTVIPFATSGGSTISHSVAQLKKQYPEINWKDGKLLNDASDSSIKKWIESLAL